MRKTAHPARRSSRPDALDAAPGRARRHYFGRVERRITTGAAVALFVLAMGFHLLLAVVVQGVLDMSWAGAKLPPGEGFMAVALLPDDDPAAQELPEEQLTEDQKKERLVENHRLLNEDRPQDSDKVSEFDHTVEREQRAVTGAEQARPMSVLP